MKKFSILFISLILKISIINASIEASEIPSTIRVTDQKIQSSKNEFKKKWDLFSEKKKFDLWKKDWTVEELKNKFDNLFNERLKVYYVDPEKCTSNNPIWVYKEEYKPADNWKDILSRYQYPLTFSYNKVDADYNASIITINNHTFLAMEAPQENNCHIFYQILNQYAVTDIVRLTIENQPIKGESCYCYWKEKESIDPVNNKKILNLGNSQINYFYTANWQDHKGYDAKELLALVQSVKRSDRQTIAVHCRAGIGRTATFIAAYILVEEIDNQIKRGTAPDNIQISIERIFWELSLQRPFAITHFPQYVSLHELVNYYIETLKTYPK